MKLTCVQTGRIAERAPRRLALFAAIACQALCLFPGAGIDPENGSLVEGGSPGASGTAQPQRGSEAPDQLTRSETTVFLKDMTTSRCECCLRRIFHPTSRPARFQVALCQRADWWRLKRCRRSSGCLNAPQSNTKPDSAASFRNYPLPQRRAYHPLAVGSHHCAELPAGGA